MKHRVADLVLEHYSLKEMSAELGMPVRTVKGYIARLYRQYKIRDGHKRVKLAVKLHNERNGFIPLW